MSFAAASPIIPLNHCVGAYSKVVSQLFFLVRWGDIGYGHKAKATHRRRSRNDFAFRWHGIILYTAKLQREINASKVLSRFGQHDSVTLWIAWMALIYSPKLGSQTLSLQNGIVPAHKHTRETHRHRHIYFRISLGLSACIENRVKQQSCEAAEGAIKQSVTERRTYI